MYLKNNSNFQCGLGTKKEILTIKPGDAVHVFDFDVININSHLVQISETEYYNLKNAKPDASGNENETSEPKKVEEPKKEEDTENKDEKVDNKESEKKENTVEKEEKEETLESLTKELEKLQEQWENTTNSKKRERIQNKVKEVKAKLDDISGTNG